MSEQFTQEELEKEAYAIGDKEGQKGIEFNNQVAKVSLEKQRTAKNKKGADLTPDEIDAIRVESIKEVQRTTRDQVDAVVQEAEDAERVVRIANPLIGVKFRGTNFRQLTDAQVTSLGQRIAVLRAQGWSTEDINKDRGQLIRMIDEALKQREGARARVASPSTKDMRNIAIGAGATALALGGLITGAAVNSPNHTHSYSPTPAVAPAMGGVTTSRSLDTPPGFTKFNKFFSIKPAADSGTFELHYSGFGQPTNLSVSLQTSDGKPLRWNSDAVTFVDGINEFTARGPIPAGSRLTVSSDGGGVDTYTF